jgi:hypothetical protein
MVVGEGDTSTVEKRYQTEADVDETGKIDGFEFESDAAPNDSSRFSIEYLLDFVKGPRKTDLRRSFTLKYSDESPIQIRRELATHSFVRSTVSPRINN